MKGIAMCNRLRNIGSDSSGNAMLFFAGGLTMLASVAALAIDTGMMFLEKRRLQGVADAAALAAAATPDTGRTAALAAISANGDSDVALQSLSIGGYSPDTTITPANRFTAGDPADNAVRVTLQSTVQPFFAQLISGRTTPIVAQATAARINLAAFSIGSRLAAVNGGLPNAILSGLAGSNINLSVMDYNALVSGNVDLLAFSDSLRTALHLDAATFGQVLSSDVALPQVAQAMAAAATDADTAAALKLLAVQLPERTVKLSSIIDLGPLSNDVRADSSKPVDVNAASFVYALLDIGGTTRQVSADVGLNVPGITSSQMTLAIGQRPGNSPWVAVSSTNKVTVRTAQARLAIVATIPGSALSGIASVKIPFFVELAQAKATLGHVSCAAGRDKAIASLDVTPSVGEVAIADFDTTAMSDFTKPLTLQPAAIVSTPLAKVTAYSDIQLGGLTSQSVTFDARDIADHAVKTVSTDDLAEGTASSLLRQTKLAVQVGGLGLNASVLTQAVQNILISAAAPLDDVIDQVSAITGVKVGQADVWIDSVRCTTPAVVK